MIKLNPCKVVFDEDSHTYTLDGRPLSGITSLIHAYTGLCSYPSANDYVRNVIIPKAGARGDSIHKSIQHLDETGETLSTIDIHWHTNQFKDGKYDPDVPRVEMCDTFDVSAPLANYKVMHKGMRTLASEWLVQYGDYASAIDNVSVDSVFYGVHLIDFKSNNLKYLKGGAEELKEYLSWQLGFYKFALGKANPDLTILDCYGFWLRDNDYQKWRIQPKSPEQIEKMLQTKWERVDGKFYYYKETKDYGRIYYGEVSPTYNEF